MIFPSDVKHLSELVYKPKEIFHLRRVQEAPTQAIADFIVLLIYDCSDLTQADSVNLGVRT